MIPATQCSFLLVKEATLEKLLENKEENLYRTASADSTEPELDEDSLLFQGDQYLCHYRSH